MRIWSAAFLCLLVPLLFSCSSLEDDLQTTGTLRVLPIEVKADVDVQPLTRSVDESLQVDIMQGSTVVRSYDAGSSELDGLVTLPVGEYTLYVHTPDMSEAQDNVLGVPTYAVKRDFKIVADKTTTLGNLQATQANVGVLLQYQEDDFMECFTSLSCTVSSPSTGRSVIISGTDNHSLAYFNIPSDGKLQYTFIATNTDGETFQSPTKEIKVSVAKNVYVLVGWDQ